ncbi:DUF4286 family protein [Serratia sp. AKBS12]|uniref:DUF4286 family protein n=1 Tax=Serratia sp. AKBS12 TaxID=2974597 RepID=UPI0021656D48|nr:DUF4286 family protein [Serratia sp. AKBS12]MCS3407277.1 hypothetical protein [Serratia sp. AKBS12]HEI8868479.1 hypothetical protein [Serratia odorifera]
MTGTPNGMLFVATDVAAQDEADFNQWYDREHVEERVRIDGFLSGTRYQALQGGRKYLGLYKTVSLDSFTSTAYHAAFTRQTPWSVACLDKMVNPMRRVCSLTALSGIGCGSHLSILTLEPGTGDALTQRARQLGEELASAAGFVCSSLLLPDAVLSTPLPKETTENRRLLPMLLIESSSVQAGQRLADQACAALNITPDAALQYALSWRLTAQELAS